MAGKKTAEFMIVNRRSGKALQATGLDNGLVVEQAEPAKTDAQTWTSLETEGGVKFFNKACGKVLDVMANGTANGTWVQTWEDVDGESQLWKLVTVSPTYKKIVNVMADKALDIVDMSDEPPRRCASLPPKRPPRRSPPPRGAAPPRPPRPRRRLP